VLTANGNRAKAQPEGVTATRVTINSGWVTNPEPASDARRLNPKFPRVIGVHGL